MDKQTPKIPAIYALPILFLGGLGIGLSIAGVLSINEMGGFFHFTSGGLFILGISLVILELTLLTNLKTVEDEENEKNYGRIEHYG